MYCCQVGVYVLFCNSVWVCADVCCVSCVWNWVYVLLICVVGVMDVVLFVLFGMRLVLVVLFSFILGDEKETNRIVI